MAVERINYQAGKTACTGALVYDERASGPRPLLLMAPNWMGVSDDAIKRAAAMAGSKYVAFVADMYGGGKIPAGPPEAMSLANALRADAPERRRRIRPRSMPCAARARNERSATSNARLPSDSVSAAETFWSSRAPAPTCRPSFACTAIC